MDVQDRVGMKVKFGPKRRYNGKVIKRPFTKRGKEVVSIKSMKKIYPEIMCNSSLLCVLDDDVCMQLLPTYKNVSNYLEMFKEYFSIKSMIKNKDVK